MTSDQRRLLKYLAVRLGKRTARDTRGFITHIDERDLAPEDRARALRVVRKDMVTWCDIFDLCEAVMGRCTRRKLMKLYTMLEDLSRRGVLQTHGFDPISADVPPTFLFEFQMNLRDVGTLVLGHAPEKRVNQDVERILQERSGAGVSGHSARKDPIDHFLRKLWKEHWRN